MPLLKWHLAKIKLFIFNLETRLAMLINVLGVYSNDTSWPSPHSHQRHHKSHIRNVVRNILSTDQKSYLFDQ